MDKFIELSNRLGKFNYEQGYFYWQLFNGSKEVDWNDSEEVIAIKEEENRRRFRRYIRNSNEKILKDNSYDFILGMNDEDKLSILANIYNYEYASSLVDSIFSTRNYYYQLVIRRLLKRYYVYKRKYRYSYEELAYYSVVVPATFISRRIDGITRKKIEFLVDRYSRVFRKWMRFLYSHYSKLYPLSFGVIRELDKSERFDDQIDDGNITNFYYFYDFEGDSESDYLNKKLNKYKLSNILEGDLINDEIKRITSNKILGIRNKRDIRKIPEGIWKDI